MGGRELHAGFWVSSLSSLFQLKAERVRGAEERERWIRMERSEVKSKRAVESISFGCPSFSFCRGTTRSSDRTDGRTEGRKAAGQVAGRARVRALCFPRPSAARPRPRRPSVHSSLVFHSSSSSIPCEREQVFGSSNRVSSLSIPRCLKKERDRGERKTRDLRRAGGAQ